jgi:nitric oxide synthase oxygenase domain/subunit
MESRKHLKKSFSLCIQYHEKSWDNKIRVILHNNFKILDFQTALKIKIVAQTSAPQQFFFFSAKEKKKKKKVYSARSALIIPLNNLLFDIFYRILNNFKFF